MQKTIVLVAVLGAAASPLSAQEPKLTDAAAAMPEPRTKEHDALKMLVGDWDCAMKSEAVPGVKGMEKASESQGREHVEVVCGGLFVKSTFDGTCDGKPCQGLFLVGYDPLQKPTTGIWADSMSPSPCTMAGATTRR